jgi:hypothetical protein
MVISIFRSCSQLIVLSYYVFCKITLYTASFTVYTVNNNKNTFVFKAMTGEVLKPKSTKAVLLPLLYRVIGRKKLYPMIAKGEYDAEKKYSSAAARFSEVESVKSDEHRHGDMVMALL